MKLYMNRDSGNSYKVQVLISLLQLPCEQINVDFATRQHKTPEFLKLNPRGEVPVIEDGGTVIWDSAACLVYLARKHGGGQWLPDDAAGMAEVQQWLALAATEGQIGLQYTRRGLKLGRWTAGTLEQGHAVGRVALATLENRLQDHDWLAGDHPTIADVACFAYVETAPESQLPLEPYPRIVAWLARCKALPGWPKR